MSNIVQNLLSINFNKRERTNLLTKSFTPKNTMVNGGSMNFQSGKLSDELSNYHQLLTALRRQEWNSASRFSASRIILFLTAQATDNVTEAEKWLERINSVWTSVGYTIGCSTGLAPVAWIFIHNNCSFRFYNTKFMQILSQTNSRILQLFTGIIRIADFNKNNYRNI